MIKKTLTLIAVILATTSLIASGSGPGKKFEASAEVTNSQGTRRMTVGLTVRHFTSDEEATQLAKLVTHSGQHGLIAALRGRSDGKLHLGGMIIPLGIVVADELDNGDFRYTFVTVRSIRAEEENLDQESLNFPFSVIVFEVGDWGTGEGKLYTAAQIHVDPDDLTVTIEQYEFEPGKIYNVKKLK